MRIALVHMRHATTGGTERYLNDLAVYLAEQGHDVTIVCRRHEAARHAAVRFTVLRPFSLGRAHRMIAFAQAVSTHVKQVSYDVVFALGKTWSHDVIRLGGGCHQTYLEQTAPATVGAAVRRYSTAWLRNRCALALEGRALASGACGHVITNSTMVKNDVVTRYQLPDDKVTVIPNGVDLNRFHPRHRLAAGAALRQQCGWTADHLVLVFLGTGYGRKGLDRLLDVLPALVEQRPRVRLVVVGHDAHLGRWRERVRRLRLEPHVRLLGGRRDPEACYGAGDLYVLPTRYDPFANATLEALACGLPVITTSANGGSEVIEDGVHGTVLQAHQGHGALLQALLMWTDLDRLKRGVAEARAQAERYSVRRELQASTAVLMQVGEAKKRSHNGR
jgi:UDP-glucose:(heptosyl)LPS alpha-1,3-glucosyltransferase